VKSSTVLKQSFVLNSENSKYYLLFIENIFIKRNLFLEWTTCDALIWWTRHPIYFTLVLSIKELYKQLNVITRSMTTNGHRREYSAV